MSPFRTLVRRIGRCAALGLLALIVLGATGVASQDGLDREWDGEDCYYRTPHPPDVSKVFASSNSYFPLGVACRYEAADGREIYTRTGSWALSVLMVVTLAVLLIAFLAAIGSVLAFLLSALRPARSGPRGAG